MAEQQSLGRKGLGRPARIALLAVLLIAVALPALLQSGLLDFSQPEGMVGDPCARGEQLRSEPGRIFRSGKERQRLQDWAGLCRFRAENESIIASGERPRVVMIGDSITELWHRDAPAFFRPGVVSRGIAGQTSAQVLLRFEQDVVALRPETVHIMTGLNDVAGNTGLTRPEDFQANMRAMVAIARANGIRVVIGSLTPASGFYWRPGIDPRPRIAELNRWLRKFAAEQGLAYADYHTVLAGADGKLQTTFDRDGVHPTAEAYAAMRPVAEAALAESAAQPVNAVK